MFHQQLLVPRAELMLSTIAQQPLFHNKTIERKPGNLLAGRFPLFNPGKLPRDQVERVGPLCQLE